VSEPVHEDETGDPVRVYVPAPAGAVVGAVCVYEVVAITVNAALDDDVLPSVTTYLTRFHWRSFVHRLLVLGLLAGMWATLVSAAAVLTQVARRAARGR
jgi:hypothetical protein